MKVKRAVAQVLAPVRPGNLGARKSVGEGDSELRLDYEPDRRAYFWPAGPTVVELPGGGGDKRTQDRDRRRAKQYWLEFKASES